MNDLAAHADFTRRLARRLLGDLQAAEDVSQEALTAALEHPRGLELGRAWLAGVVRNLASNRRRAVAVRRYEEQRMLREQSVREDPTERLKLAQRVAAAALELEEPYRTAVLRRFLHGESHGQIARDLGIEAATVRQRVSRGVAQLRARLEREFDGRPGGLLGVLVPLASTQSVPLGAMAGWAAALMLAVGLGWWLPRRVSSGEGDRMQPTILEPAQNLETAGVERRPGEDIEANASVGAPLRSELAGSQARRIRIGIASEADGRPLIAQVFAWDGEVVESFTSGADGSVLLDAKTRAVLAIAVDHGWAGITLSSEQQANVTLPPEAAITGTVWVEGQPCLDDDCLALEQEEADPPPVPAAFWSAILASPAYVEARLERSNQGDFEVRGLLSGQRVRLVAQSGYQLKEASAGPGGGNPWPGARLRPFDVSLVAPADGLALELVRTQPVSGRVLWAESGQPVTEGRVEVAVLYRDGTQSYRSQHDLGPDGRYAAGVFPYADPYARPELRSVRIEVHPTGGGPGTFLFGAQDLTQDPSDGGHGLPDVQIERVADVWMELQDPSGQAIADAFVAGDLHRDYGTYRRHVRSDEQGRVRLRGVPRDLESLLVGALGYRTQAFSLGARGSSAEPLVLRLEPCASVHLRLPEGDSDEIDASLELLGDGPLLLREQAGWARREERFFEIMGLAGDTEEGSYSLYDPWDGPAHREGGWWLWDALPGRRWVAVLRDDGGRVLSKMPFVTPSGDEQLELTLPEPPPRRALLGRVVDDQSRGIGQARVHWEWSDGSREWLGRTDGAGAFTTDLPMGMADPAWIELRAEGFVFKRLAWPGADADGDLGDLALERAGQLEVTVVDTRGSVLPVHALAAVDASGQLFAGQFTDGRNRLKGLPANELELSVTVGGRTYRRSGVFAGEAVRIEVPVHGVLELDVGLVGPHYNPEEARRDVISALDDPGFELTVRTDQPREVFLLPGRYRLGEVEFNVEADERVRISL